jgi:hypothetical protein
VNKKYYICTNTYYKYLVCMQYIFLMELSIVILMCNVEYEISFFMLKVVKSKLQNWLIKHLDPMVWMHVQEFYILETFPFYHSKTT